MLRNGYISNARAENRQTMAVNLTSERVRTALSFLEGIRAGQSLADFSATSSSAAFTTAIIVADVDEFIYKLRKAFPLRADRLNSTKTEEGVPIEAIEARNVIDGLAFVEHMKATTEVFPFGKAGLPRRRRREGGDQCRGRPPARFL